MKRLSRPDTWFWLALVLSAALGAVLLAQPSCTPQADRDVEYFWAYHFWQCAFDALSAACGAGLLTKNFDQDYTATGRWVLTAIGSIGALLYLAACLQALRRMGSSLTVWSPPRLRVVAGMFLACGVVLFAVLLIAQRLGAAPPAVGDTALTAIAAFASLGFVREVAAQSSPAVIAIIAWIAALGWPVWLFAAPPLLKKHVQARQAAIVGVSYTLLIVLAALLIAGFETPRGGRGPSGPSDDLSGQVTAVRLQRGLVQAASAAGAGIQTEQLAERRVSEGAKATLALLMLVGPCGLAAGGGITWLLLAWALAGAVVGAAERDRSAGALGKWIAAGQTCVVSLGLAAIVCAAGLLLIEGLTASRFAPAPSLADAMLDACSAVGGGALSGGLTETVTAKNLTSGIRMPVDLYQIGMVWLMLTMLAGRLIPIIVLRRLADALTPPK